jgi:predicted nucleic acid-binding protein
MTVLLDNTVLSNFSIVCRPDLVRLALAEQVGATEQALQEMQEGVAIDKIPACDWDWLARVILTPAEQPHFETLHECLGAGEASSLAVAQERGYRLATDDKDARRLARQLGISLTGTIGILGMLVRKDEISLIEGDRLLREMVAAGYHSPVSTLEDVLSQ